MFEEKKEPFSIYITKSEKEFLKQKANSLNMSMQSYVRNELLKNNNRNSSMIGSFQTEEIFNGSIERNRAIKIFLSEEEFLYIKKLAGHSTISAFVRKVLLTANSGKFVFDIKTGDIDDLRKHLNEFNMRMEGIIGALRYRSELYASDIANMKRLLEEVNENIRKGLSTVMTDRKYVRKKGVQHLQEQIDKLLKTMEQEGEISDSHM